MEAFLSDYTIFLDNLNNVFDICATICGESRKEYSDKFKERLRHSKNSDEIKILRHKLILAKPKYNWFRVKTGRNVEQRLA